jgi:predicted PurR-regulated permease PerM
MQFTANSKVYKMAAISLVLCLFVTFFYLAQGILIPLIIAFIIAIILFPIHRFLNKRLRLPNFLASLLSVSMALGAIVLVILLLSKQIASVFDDIPEITKNLETHFANFQKWVNSIFGFSIEQQTNLIENVNADKIPKGSLKSLGGITDVLLNSILVPIYIFFILMYKENFVRFFEFFAEKTIRVEKSFVLEIIKEINSVIRNYVLGLFFEMIIVAILTGFGLWIIGLKYFLFLGVLTAVLNLIPYIGILIACSVSVLMSLVGSSDLSMIFGVIIVNVIVQFIDNNILIPKVVGSKVSINALASMVGVIVGGTLAGIGGMFLALPMLAIIKIICDRIEKLKAFGYLIGDHSKTDISNLLTLKLFKFIK